MELAAEACWWSPAWAFLRRDRSSPCEQDSPGIPGGQIVIGRKTGGLRAAEAVPVKFPGEQMGTECYDVVMIPFEEKMRRGGGAAIEEASRFFMKQGPVHEALRRIAA